MSSGPTRRRAPERSRSPPPPTPRSSIQQRRAEIGGAEPVAETRAGAMSPSVHAHKTARRVDHQQPLASLGGDRRRALQLDRARARDQLELLSPRSADEPAWRRAIGRGAGLRGRPRECGDAGLSPSVSRFSGPGAPVSQPRSYSSQRRRKPAPPDREPGRAANTCFAAAKIVLLPGVRRQRPRLRWSHEARTRDLRCLNPSSRAHGRRRAATIMASVTRRAGACDPGPTAAARRHRSRRDRGSSGPAS